MSARNGRDAARVGVQEAAANGGVIKGNLVEGTAGDGAVVIAGNAIARAAANGGPDGEVGVAHTSGDERIICARAIRASTADGGCEPTGNIITAPATVAELELLCLVPRLRQ